MDGTESVSRRLALAALVVAVVLAPVATAVVTAGSTPGTGTERPGLAVSSDVDEHSRGAIVAVYPDPVTDGDRGECVVVDLPEAGGANWSLSDGEDSIEIPHTDGDDRLGISDDPEVACRRADARPIAVEDMLELSNAGETLTLRADGTVVDRVTYDRARAAHWYRNGSWHPLGETDFAPATVRGGTGRVFVLPDSPDVPVAPLRNATDRILLAGYSFESERVARALRAAVDRGVRVRVLLDGAPVGGRSRREARILDRLEDAGVDVRVIGGPRARYAFHHAKYAVVDDRAVVLTENWKPAGVGGRSSRGWGVVLGEPTAQRLARVFRADATAPDAISWAQYRADRNFSVADGDESARTYPTRFPSRRVPVDRVEVFVAPDNAGREVRELLRSANESIRVVQM
ncbi:MAG: phospholipase D-like domain-containing protein, partial [Halanaeroarchaeum sp.]